MALVPMQMGLSVVYHKQQLTFNENGKYIFTGSQNILSAFCELGNYAILISNNLANACFTLYDITGQNWTRVTSQPSIYVIWYTAE